jgi:hypothetical protein
MAEIPRLKLHRLCPAEAREDDKQKPDYVDVSEGIEAEASLIPGGIIAKFVCRQSVAVFVNRQAKDYAGEGIDDILPVHAAVILPAAFYQRLSQNFSFWESLKKYAFTVAIMDYSFNG